MMMMIVIQGMHTNMCGHLRRPSHLYQKRLFLSRLSPPNPPPTTIDHHLLPPLPLTINLINLIYTTTTVLDTGTGTGTGMHHRRRAYRSAFFRPTGMGTNRRTRRGTIIIILIIIIIIIMTPGGKEERWCGMDTPRDHVFSPGVRRSCGPTGRGGDDDVGGQPGVGKVNISRPLRS